MALEGTIKDFGLPDIFQLIGLQRKTGLLTLKRDREQVTVTFDSGNVVAADTSEKRLEDRLGNVLVKQGHLTQHKLDEALQVQKQTLQRLGHVLVASGAITGKDLKAAIQVQVSGIVFKLFRWKEGEYHFAPADSVDYDKENFAPMSSDFILMEGIRMLDEWPIIEKKIPSMDIVFKGMVDPSMIGSGESEGDEIGIEEAKTPASSKISLAPDEQKVFAKVDGKQNVQAIIDGSGLGEFDTCRVLFDLLNRKIIAPVGRGATAQQALAGPAAESSAMPGYIALGLAVVLSLVGLGLQLRSPFGILGVGPLLEEPAGLLLEDVSRARLERIDAAALAYSQSKGAPPASLDELTAASLVERRYLKDAQGRPFEYTPTQQGYRLRTAEGVEVERVLSPQVP